MNSIDETLLMSLFAHTQQKVIAQDIFESYNIHNPGAIKSAISEAAWQGFVAGMQASQRYYGNKE